jgi:serine/threonine protein kinase
VDVFSTGVIVYMMLTGIHPFNCEDYKGLISLNLACEIDYSKVHITEDGMNFLKSVLDPNPETRLNS